MKFKILQSISSEKSPTFLDAVLAEDYNPSQPMPPMDYSWTRIKRGEKIQFPDALFLIANYKEDLEFDYLPQFNGFIISREFKELLEENTSEDYYQIVPLNSVNIGGQKNSKKEYYYLTFFSPFTIIDYVNSEYVVKRRANKALVLKRGVGVIGFDKIVLKEDLKIDKSFFMINDSIFLQGIVITEAFEKLLAQKEFFGFEIVTLKEYAESYRKLRDPNYTVKTQ